MQPRSLKPPKKKSRLPKKALIGSVAITILAAAYAAFALLQPIHTLQPNAVHSQLAITTQASNLPWPNYGEGAFGLADGTVITTHGQQVPVSTASAAKLITALVVLDKHPLAAGQSGPIIAITANDAALYQYYATHGGSVMPVRAGMQLTERQMLEGLLLPSANNIADSLAIWSYGSMANYITQANNFLQAHNLLDTHVAGDASGFLPDTTSTASDLVKIGGMVMQNPVLASVVGERVATIPGVGLVSNYNSLLGSNNIVGIKTGNNDVDLGVFVGAATAHFDGKTTTIITALAGAPSLKAVLQDSGNLLAAAQTTFADTLVVKSGTVLGGYVQSDGQRLQAVAAGDLNTTVLRGSTVKATVQLRTVNFSATAGQKVGTVSVAATEFAPARSVPVILKQTPSKPGLWYRLTHP